LYYDSLGYPHFSGDTAALAFLLIIDRIDSTRGNECSAGECHPEDRMGNVCTIAIVGATGLMGSELIALLEESSLPVDGLRLFASPDSAGEVYSFKGERVVVEELTESSFSDIAIALFVAGPGVSSEWIPVAKAGGTKIIDVSGSSHDDSVPVIVCGLNDSLNIDSPHVANPLPSVLQLAPLLHHIHVLGGIERAIITTYQSVSSAGKDGVDELWEQTLAVFNQQEIVSDVFPCQIAFNCIPQVGLLAECGISSEERNCAHQTIQALNTKNLPISVTAVRVPVLHGAGQSLVVETKMPLSPTTLAEKLSEDSRFQLYSLPDHPTILSVVGQDEIHVGRIRQDAAFKNGIACWTTGDPLRLSARNALGILTRYLGIPAQ
jgi:aspartate-semialdehyde dehydrogenase